MPTSFEADQSRQFECSLYLRALSKEALRTQKGECHDTENEDDVLSTFVVTRFELSATEADIELALQQPPSGDEAGEARPYQRFAVKVPRISQRYWRAANVEVSIATVPNLEESLVYKVADSSLLIDHQRPR